MAEKKNVKKGAQKPVKASKAFTDEERSAMRERVREMKAGGKEDEATAVVEKIAALTPTDRAMATRVHAIITGAVPELTPKLWYGMPAYAKDGQVVCFFQPAQKFKTRYATLGFSDKAMLDDGHMWPTSYALTELTTADEARIVALVRKAAS